ncbi:MAG: tRNA lysidine(34) synthetase TilS [Nitrospinales bacterium]|nr:tRNA lysidine(34) synthetase TilS [Nitrospinales bacterium]
MHPVEQKFKIAMSQMVSSENRILVAVSGGPDSVVLLHLLNKYKLEVSNLTLAIAHLNHLSRGVDSNKDSDFVVRLGRTLKIETFVESVDVALLGDKMKTSFQESARIVRHDFLRKVSDKWDGDLIALGHNSDDQAETFLINLLRGSGLRGLTGTRSRRGDFIRPLHNCSRSEIEDYISAQGLEFRLDKSNVENCYLRNKIRLDLIPFLERYNPNIKKSLVSTSRLLADDEDYLEKQVEKGMVQVDFNASDKNFISIDINLFDSQHPALQKRLIRQAILVTKGDLRSISARHVLDLIDMMKHEKSSKEMHLPGSLTAVCANGKLFICKSHHYAFVINKIFPDGFMSKDINVPGSTETGFRGLCFNIKLVAKKDVNLRSSSLSKAYLDYDKTGPNLKMRFFRPGDRFIPLGMRGTKKLKSFFIDEKIPRNQRKSIPLLTSKNDDIIWVYEKRIGECYKVTDKTTNILLIEGTVGQNLIEKSLGT